MRGISLNWKVTGGLGVVALGVVALVPQLALAVLPILVIAACPLSCLFMMRGMGKGSSYQTSSSSMPGRSMDGAMSQNERIAHLEGEIRRFRAQESGVTSELERSESTDLRQPVA